MLKILRDVKMLSLSLLVKGMRVTQELGLNLYSQYKSINAWSPGINEILDISYKIQHITYSV